MDSAGTKKIDIRQENVALIAEMCRQLPEFQNPYSEAEITTRLASVPHLILVAYREDKPVGFKVGYDRGGSFYSWLGGVLPSHRRCGVAKALAVAQEEWAAQQGYTEVCFKTRNKHKAMLVFALKIGFDITGFEERKDVLENRIWLRKRLFKK